MTTPAAGAGGVHSVQRAFALLELIADAGGEAGLSELAVRSGLPLPTIHRLVHTLIGCGYVRQQPSRRYALAPRLMRLGDSAAGLLGTWARPHLAALVAAAGETANLAVLDGDMAAYVAQVPSPHSMRMFTEVGRRVFPHCTAVGKAILAELPDGQVRALLARTGMPAQTDRTLTAVDDLVAELRLVRERGYALDDGEQEVGVRCVAVAVRRGPGRLALSVSGPDTRVTGELVARVVPELQRAADELGGELADPPALEA